MKLEEFRQFTADILSNLSDQGKVSEILTTLVDDYVGVSENLNTLTGSNSKLLEDMESLRSANMKLFLKIGDKPLDEPTPNDKKDITTNQENEVMSFENLFTNEGGLK